MSYLNINALHLVCDYNICARIFIINAIVNIVNINSFKKAIECVNVNTKYHVRNKSNELNKIKLLGTYEISQ